MSNIIYFPNKIEDINYYTEEEFINIFVDDVIVEKKEENNLTIEQKLEKIQEIQSRIKFYLEEIELLGRFK